MPSSAPSATPAAPLPGSTQGWTGRLAIEGGPLKLLYFVHVASIGKPSRNRTVWEVRVEIPDYDRPNSRLEGIYVLEFDKPIPRVFPDSSSRSRDQDEAVRDDR